MAAQQEQKLMLPQLSLKIFKCEHWGVVDSVYEMWGWIRTPFQVSEEEEDDGGGEAAAVPEAVLEVLGRARVDHVVDQEAEIQVDHQNYDLNQLSDELVHIFP